MRGGWKRFGLYVLAVSTLIALVFFATRGEPRTIGLVAALVVFVACGAYLITFMVWPRRIRVHAAPPLEAPAEPRVAGPPRAEPDRRPVAVIGDRPAGSKPGSRVHIPEAPTNRGNRGRRPDRRQSTGEIKWPVQR